MNLVTVLPANEPLASPLSAFSSQLGTSRWWTTLAPIYGLTGVTHADFMGGAITQDISQSEIQTYLASAAAAQKSTGTTLYLLYLPSGVSFSDSVACSYHATYTGAGAAGADAFAVVSRACLGGTPGETELSYLTRQASHEIFEAASNPTDDGWTFGSTPNLPWTHTVWSSLQEGDIELADLCEGSRLYDPGVDGGWEYQRIWSNPAALDGGDPCAPSVPTPYFSVTTAQDWFAVPAGTSLEISLAGWTTGPTSDSIVRPELENGTAAMRGVLGEGGGTITTDAGLENQAGCYPRDGMSAGRTGTLTVFAPSTAVSGDWAVVSVNSFHEEPLDGGGCAAPLTEDSFHWA